MSAERELLVNIDCPIRIIIDYIRQVVKLNGNGEFDLCDEPLYQMKNIFSYQPYVSGLEILQPSTTYIIIQYERDVNGVIKNPVPVVPGRLTNKALSDIMTKIRRQSKKAIASANSKMMQEKVKVS